jgi:hypothetical protein
MSAPGGLARPARWLSAAAWMGGIFYLSHQSSPIGTAPGEAGSVLAHLGLFAGLALLFSFALAGGGNPSGESPLWAVALLAFALTVLYGVADETHQAFVPGRVASEADIALDAAGAVIGMTLAHVISWRLNAREGCS